MHPTAHSPPRPASARFDGPRIHVPGIGRLFVRELTDKDDPSFQILLTAPQTPASGGPILQTGRLGLAGEARKHAVIGLFAPTADGGERLLGVGGLQVCGSNDEIGSFGVLVDAPVRGLGLGQLLLAKLLKLAEAEEVPVMFARISPTNRSMLALARNLGFNVQRVPGDLPLLLSFALAASGKDDAKPAMRPGTVARTDAAKSARTSLSRH